jgi:hypothetical protein
MMFDTWEAYSRHRHEIAALLDPRYHTIEWIDDQVALGFVTAFHNDEAIILCEINDYPTGAQDIHGLVAAGALESILPLITEAEEWAIEQGCIGAEIASRPAWAKVLEPHGYRLHQVTIKKDLR